MFLASGRGCGNCGPKPPSDDNVPGFGGSVPIEIKLELLPNSNPRLWILSFRFAGGVERVILNQGTLAALHLVVGSECAEEFH